MPTSGKKSTNDAVNKFGHKSGVSGYTFGGKFNVGKKLSTNIDNFENNSKKKSDLER